jgi:hypothetical protein
MNDLEKLAIVWQDLRVHSYLVDTKVPLRAPRGRSIPQKIVKIVIMPPIGPISSICLFFVYFRGNGSGHPDSMKNSGSDRVPVRVRALLLGGLDRCVRLRWLADRRGIIAQRRDGFQAHVACALYGPLIVLFEQQSTDESDDGGLAGKMPTTAARDRSTGSATSGSPTAPPARATTEGQSGRCRVRGMVDAGMEG